MITTRASRYARVSRERAFERAARPRANARPGRFFFVSTAFESNGIDGNARKKREVRGPGVGPRRARRPTPTDARFPDVFTLFDDRFFFRSTRSRRSSPSLAPEQAGLAGPSVDRPIVAPPQRWHPKRPPERAHNFYVAHARQPLCSPWRIPGRRRRRPWTCHR